MLIAKHLNCGHLTEEAGANFYDDQKCLHAIKAVVISNDHYKTGHNLKMTGSLSFSMHGIKNITRILQCFHSLSPKRDHRQ